MGVAWTTQQVSSTEERPPALTLAVDEPPPRALPLLRRRDQSRPAGVLTLPIVPSSPTAPSYAEPAREEDLSETAAAPPPPAIPVPAATLVLPDPAPAAGPEPVSVPMTVSNPEAPAPTAIPPLPAVIAPPARDLVPPSGVQRRDPVLPPLEEASAWRELVLSVSLNGEPVSQGVLFVESPADGGLAIQLAALEAWRIRYDPDRVLTFQGEPYYPLAAIQGAVHAIERDALALTLVVPPEGFLPLAVAAEPEPRLPPVAGTGAFLDYDLLVQTGSELEDEIEGLAEIGAFGSAGTLLSNFRLESLLEAPEITRLDTTFARDLPDRRATLRIGDSLTVGGGFSAPVRFGGIQFATNFATDPSFVTFPLPTIGGLAEQRSVVDVFIDNVQRATRDVPPGPFALESLPVVSGAGEVQLRVTDLLGRERLVTQSYYVSPRLLKKGLSDYAFELGFERDAYGVSSFDYGDAIASSTYRYGISDALTGEAHLELQLDQQSLVVGSSFLIGQYGVLSAGAGAGSSDDGAGVLGELAYEYDGRRFGFGLRTRYMSEDFRQAGYRDDVARTDQANLSFDLGGYGRAGLLLLNREGRGSEDDATSLAGTFSVPLGPGALTLRAAQLIRPDDELALTASFSMPLGPRGSASVELQRRGDGHRARAQHRQTRGPSDLGLDWRIGATLGDERQGADARLSYQSSLGSVELEGEQADGERNLRAGVSGSAVLVDGELALSRRLGRAFGMVALPGFPDVRVYLDNREVGRTDQDGNLLLPLLRPYERNQVRLEVEDLPLEAEVRAAEVAAVPFDRSGMTIAFSVRRLRQATATLRDGAGVPVAAGTRLATADSEVTAWVARDGFTQITGSLAAPVELRTLAGPPFLACALPAVDADPVLPDLGEITCR